MGETGTPFREVLRLEPGLEADFLALHSQANDAGWCRCVAWHVPTWEGWGERSAEENLALRRGLWAQGDHDAYLLRLDRTPVASLQAGVRSRLPKLESQLRLAPDPGVWALTCFFVAPAQRGRGHASFLLDEVLSDLRERGVRRVEAYPRCGSGLDDGDAWTGPEAIYRAAGFDCTVEGAPRSVFSLEL